MRLVGLGVALLSLASLVACGSSSAKPGAGSGAHGGDSSSNGGATSFGGELSSGGFLTGTPCGADCPNPGVTALETLTDLPLLKLDTHARSFSSVDPKLLNNDHDNYLYVDGQESVVFDSEGPGIINRWWHTGDLSGEYHLYFDGETTPSKILKFMDFWTATISPFVSPLSLNDNQSSGGFVTYYPIAFSKSLKISAVGQKPQDYFNFTYTRYTERDVPTFTGTEPMDRVISLFNTPGVNPTDPADGDAKATGTAKVDAGGTMTLTTLTGPAEIIGLSMTLPNSASGSLGAFGTSHLQIFWDDETMPSVDAPVAEFFGMTQTQNAQVKGLPVGHLGDQFYCFFPMPFAKSAKVQLVNGAGTAVDGVSYEIVSRALTADFSQLGYFHVLRNSTDATTQNKDFTMLSVTGSGHYVGLNMFYPSVGDTLEGNERMFVDGSRSPAINGTGTEDYFNGGYYFDKGAFTTPTHGAPTFDGKGPFNAYRFHFGDVIAFSSSVLVNMQHGSYNTNMVPYASIAYFYLNAKVRSTQTDSLDLSDAASISQHAYVAQGTATAAITAQFMSDDAMMYTHTGQMLTGPGTFKMKVDATNQGVTLRRLLDQSVGKQSAIISVDGVTVGRWKTPEVNPNFRWREDDFWLPSAATMGKSEITVKVAPEGPWNEFSYVAYSLLPP